MTWSAKQYLAFEDERTRPVRDLLSAVPAIDARAAVDIGCGPGNSTEQLAARFPHALVSGLDSSADMIAAARERLPNVRFEVSDIQAWLETDPDPVDVILANAVLQWVSGHRALFPALLGRLAPSGALAVQMPDNLQEPAQLLMREVAAEGPWSRKLAAAGEARVTIESADWYFRLLRSSGARVEVWRTTYYHSLESEKAIVEWFRATGLRPFLEPLDPDERASYLRRYTEAIRRAYPAAPDGSVLLPFPRVFIVAIR